MYSEVVQVKFPGGIHNGTLDALRVFAPHGLRVAGLDPSDGASWQTLMQQYRDPSSQVELTVDNPDPQMARDIATIARKMIWEGRNLWPGRQIPPEMFNTGANHIRRADGLPEEGGEAGSTAVPQQPQPAAPMAAQASHDKINANASVSGEMTIGTAKWSVLSPGKKEAADKHDACPKHEEAYRICGCPVPKDKKEANWQVVALGEMQQPGGVGETQGYNPVVDGPNPDGPDMLDSADNSFEQQTAMQTWVNYAVEMLNAGDQDDVIVAKLSHDGCPDPQGALERAKMQPVEEIPAPVSDEIGQDPFKNPPPADQTGQMESVSQQPPMLGSRRVRIANTSLTGIEIDRWEDLWGQGAVKIALDDGGTMSVSPDAVEEIESEQVQHPVSQIQEFIDGLPEVEPTRPHIEARIANMQLVRKACRENMQKVGFSDQVKLDTIDSDAQNEILTLKEFLGAVVSESDMAYLSGQQTYRPQGQHNVATSTNEEFNKKIAEKARIFVAELGEEVVRDDEAVAYAAAMHATANNGNVPEFVRLAQEAAYDKRFERADGQPRSPRQQEEEARRQLHPKGWQRDPSERTVYGPLPKVNPVADPNAGLAEMIGEDVPAGITPEAWELYKKRQLENEGPAEGLFL